MKRVLQKSAIAGVVGLSGFGAVPPPLAQPLPSQAPFNPEDTLIQPRLPDPLPETLLEEEAPSLPSERAPLPPTAPRGPESQRRFRVAAVELLGVTLPASVFNQLTARAVGVERTISEQLDTIVGQVVTLDDLLALRTFISDAYINAGYLTSGAFLPEQTFADGSVITIQVVEGDLERFDIRGLARLRERYVRDRLQARIRRPLKQEDIVTALRLLQLDPLINTVDAELLAGSGPGLSILSLEIQEAAPISAALTIDNYRSPSIGSVQLSPTLGYANLLGLGDRLTVAYGLTPGLNTYAVDYTVPLTARDTTFRFGFSSSNSRILEDNFELLGIRSNSRTFSFGLRHPVVRTPAQELALGIAFEQRSSQTFIFDDVPFPFSPGSVDGESRVSAVRFFQDWVTRTPNQVLAARSQFSLGIDAFDATLNEVGPDGKFFSWQGQLQWVRRLPRRHLLVARFSGQFTPDALLSLEQFSLGGVQTVRGYRTNQLVTDNGAVGSLEWRIPLSANLDELMLTPFVEGGIGWDQGEAAKGLASVGLGLRWQLDPHVNLHIDAGFPLIEAEPDGNSLQEEGISLSLEWSL